MATSTAIALLSRAWLSSANHGLPLQHHRETLADADADRGDGDAAAATGEFVGRVADDASARGAERMPDRDRAAVDVDDLGVEVGPRA